MKIKKKEESSDINLTWSIEEWEKSEKEFEKEFLETILKSQPISLQKHQESKPID
jgi:hypothetical protein